MDERGWGVGGVLRRLMGAVQGVLERVRVKEVPDGNPEYL